MARLNLEESLWSDPRTMRLIAKIGDEDKAIGILVRAFRLAQKYWCNKENPKQYIHPEAFLNEKLEILIDINWAKKYETGYYIHGSESNFSWWFQRVEAGRNGGIAKASGAKRKLAEAKQNVASSSSSSSSSLEHNTIAQQVEQLYKEYPRKEGKTKGIQKLIKEIKTQDDISLLAKSINNYKMSCGTDIKYIKHFSSFASVWRDYISDNAECKKTLTDKELYVMLGGSMNPEQAVRSN